jgi:formylglycine-generating enzyme required for sulfatase activity
VTVAQYKIFVQETKHKPFEPDCLIGISNHPVVAITWNEALEYCGWLCHKLKAWQGTPQTIVEKLVQGWQVTLLAEIEWEKAARGGLQLPKGENPNPNRIYSWGDEFDTDKANTSETGINETSAVGCFPGGASPYGILDLSGNVWEWTAAYLVFPLISEILRKGRKGRSSLLRNTASFAAVRSHLVSGVCVAPTVEVAFNSTRCKTSAFGLCSPLYLKLDTRKTRNPGKIFL